MEQRGRGRPSLLTEQVMQQIIASITAGAYDWVAAEAAGVSNRSFYRWMAQGEKDEEAEIESDYRHFWQDVKQARASARLVAETKVATDSPFNWLRFGPGKSRPDEPGWTENVEISGTVGGAIKVKLKFADELPKEEEHGEED